MRSGRQGLRMSRQRAGWGLSRWLEGINRQFTKKSETAGINKYDPQTANREGEAARRKAALDKLMEKYARKVGK